jgi:hypothetical protein
MYGYFFKMQMGYIGAHAARVRQLGVDDSGKAMC